jgi:DNA-binding CsgD family transcriptional regulator
VRSFVGRDLELARLNAVVDSAVSSGRRATAVVEGDAGEGKSALLARVATLRRDVAVVRAQADELAPDRIMLDLDRRLGPDGGSIVERLDRASAAQPVLLLVDDLHWADGTDLRELARVYRETAESPVAWCFTLRSEPRSPELHQFLDQRWREGVTSIVLHPLADDDVATLAESVLGHAPSPDLLDWLGRADGNAFYLSELLDAAATDRPGEWGRPPLPATLAAAVQRRAGVLGDETRHLLTVASVLGNDFEPDDLAALTRRSVVDLAARLGDGVRAGLLADAGDRLQFRHQIVHDVIYWSLAEPLRASLHREIAGIYAARPNVDARLAQHLLRAAVGRDDASVNWFLAAARRLADELSHRSLPVLDRALGLVSASDPRALDIRVAAVHPMLLAGRPEDAAATARRLLARELPPEARAQVLHALLAALQYQGRFAEVRDLGRAALEDAGAPREVRAAAGSRLAFAELVAGDLEAAGDVADRMRALITTTDPTSLQALALATAGMASLGRGDLRGAIAKCEQAVEIAPAIGGIAMFLGLAYLESDEDPDVQLETAARLDIDRDAAGAAVAFGALAIGALHRGALEASLEHVESGVAAADAFGTWVPETHFIHAVRARVALHEGDNERAGSAIEEALALRDPTPRGAMHDFTGWVHGCVKEAEGNDAGALAALLDAWVAGAPRRYFITWRFLAPTLVRVALQCGHRDVARDVVDELTRTAPRETLSADACVRRCTGLLAGDVNVLATAATAYDEARRPLAAAAAREEAAALLSPGHPRRSELLDHAIATYHRAGAGGDAARALRLGGRGRGRPRRPVKGWKALTRAQLEVARHVALGLSNPEIAAALHVSRYTVATHLKHVFAKLDVSSRAELAARVTRELP